MDLLIVDLYEKRNEYPKKYYELESNMIEMKNKWVKYTTEWANEGIVITNKMLEVK